MGTKKDVGLNKPLFNEIYSYVIENFKLSHRDSRVFFRLLGIFLLNDKPFTYTTEKLAKRERYSVRTIDRGFNALEELGLITRSGHSYRRKFNKGPKLIEIWLKIQNSSINEQVKDDTIMPNNTKNERKENGTPASSCHGTPSFGHDITSRGRTLELQEEIKELTTTTVVVAQKNNNTPYTQITGKTAQYETQLREAYKHTPLIDEHIKTEHDFIDYCNWSIRCDRPEDVSIYGRVKSLITFLKEGRFETSKKWINKKKGIKSPYNQAYQEYAGDIKQQIRYGKLPETTKIMTLNEFLITSKTLNED